MSRIRVRHSKKSKYYLEKHALYTAIHYALQYLEWKEEHKALIEKGAGALSYSDEPHGTDVTRPTERDGIRAYELARKIEIIENAVMEAAAPAVQPYLLYAVTHEYVSFADLEAKEIPCGRKYYYAARRKFYWYLSNKI